jgi:hypothetical protein
MMGRELLTNRQQEALADFLIHVMDLAEPFFARGLTQGDLGAALYALGAQWAGLPNMIARHPMDLLNRIPIPGLDQPTGSSRGK